MGIVVIIIRGASNGVPKGGGHYGGLSDYRIVFCEK